MNPETEDELTEADLLISALFRHASMASMPVLAYRISLLYFLIANVMNCSDVSSSSAIKIFRFLY